MKQRRKEIPGKIQATACVDPSGEKWKAETFLQILFLMSRLFEVVRNWTREEFWRNTFKSCNFHEQQTMVGAAEATPQTRPYTVDWENSKTRLGNMFLTFILVLGYAQLTIRSNLLTRRLGIQNSRENNKKQGTADMRPAKYWTEVIIICPHSPK